MAALRNTDWLFDGKYIYENSTRRIRKKGKLTSYSYRVELANDACTTVAEVLFFVSDFLNRVSQRLLLSQKESGNNAPSQSRRGCVE